MILCLDIGNSHIFGGCFAKGVLQAKFRYASQAATTSDAFGVFLKGILLENKMNTDSIQSIAMSSVVPHVSYSVRAACIKYLGITPFELTTQTPLPIQIDYQTPHTLGVDRIANAIAASAKFPHQPVIVVSFGTATTLCVITETKRYIGGAIMPGFRIARDSLADKTAKLPAVDIIKPNQALGHSTEQCIQTGLYYAQLGAVQSLIKAVRPTLTAAPVVVATGGFSHLFAEEAIFDAIMPDLILEGIYFALMYHSKQSNQVAAPSMIERQQ